MSFAPGDAIHLRGIGKGVVREVRNGGRYLVEVSGRSIVATIDQLTPAEKPEKKKKPSRVVRPVYEPPSEAAFSLDLHGLTIDEAVETIASFLNDALMRGAAEVRIIHGRSGGKLKSALHRQLKAIGAVRDFRIDPRNEGVTVVKL